jgi:dTDP-4-dehydrorhamnose reductase
MAAAAAPQNVPTVLVLGASGMLGRAIHKALQGSSPDQFAVVGTGHTRAAALGLKPLDVTDAAALRACLAEARPALVISCVAERRPDRVELDEAHARRLNVELVERLAEDATQQGFHLVHISTDYVFDGTSPPYAPGATPNPLNAYGRHKLAAEEVLRKVGRVV